MARDFSRYDDRYGGARGKTNVFGWSIAILLLTGFAFAAWLGSFYIFGQPERPQSYRILKKLHKIEPTKRFELTVAPAGEFLNPKQLFDRYSVMLPTELATKNAELARNYIRNFQQVRGLVPYVVGRFQIMAARELTSRDVFTSGMVALASALDQGELLIEHVYPADAQVMPLMKQTLVTGLEIKLERTHDLSAVIHADRLADGRIMITTVPLLYGTYTVSRGTGAFSLEPPLDLNLAAGWPLFKETIRRRAEENFAAYRQSALPPGQGVPVPGLPTPPPVAAANELIRVEPAAPVPPPQVAVASSKHPPPPPKPTPTPKGGKLAKNQKTSPPPASPAQQPAGAQRGAVPTAQTTPAGAAIAKATPPVGALPSATSPVVSAVASPPITSIPPTVLPAQPLPGDALASTAGGANWKTYPAGKMPVGRLIATSDLRDVADRGIAGERVYLKGQFVVNFTETNRAVLRPRTKLTDTVLHFGSGAQSARIIVEYPTGYTPPQQGSVVTRDEARPYEITEVRKQADGQLNVFVREIMQ
ncbi:MAG: hypothetical protein ABI944_03420 [Chthoniobacterales bacterium]